ncbi:MAG: acetyl-CoA C-acyltransferase [Acidimicrobiia bacterium]|nr:acetyl-CoA C-acyltransferase [Acidimicrobiia bacterium]MDH5615764.1 acetyl-CoA C-acyltransferase [Acidimicrobiia bacterium]
MGAVITGIARTPLGKFGGGLAPLRAVELGSAAIQGALQRSQLDPARIDEVIFGQVLQAGEGQITARQAAVRAGVPMTVPSTTVNKVCLSGMTAIAMADRSVRLGEASFVVAGGMESMSNAPYLTPSTRWGARMGDVQLIDVMLHDGLWCSFDHCAMGESSDLKNAQLGISRRQQDTWAAESHRRASQAVQTGVFQEEIVTVQVPQRKGDPVAVELDEGIRPDTTVESLSKLRSAFTAEGTTTAANASQISDGAAAVIVADRAAAKAAGLPILAEIIAYGQIGGPDATLQERPAEALGVALKKAGMSAGDLDLVEINEAFASVALWSAQMLDLGHDKVNVNGGAIALGHPIGATGARLIVTLVNELRRRGGGIGGASLCGGGGQGDALIIKVEV